MVVVGLKKEYAIKFELNKLARSCPDDDVLTEIRRVASIAPTAHLSRAEFDTHSKISSSSVIKRFGGWESALIKAGIADKYAGPQISTRLREQRGRNMSEPDIIAEIQRVVKILGKDTITMSDFNTHATISTVTVNNRLGSWNKALEKAGVNISARGRRHTDSDYFENMLTVWTHHGRQPKHREMDEPPSVITSGAYEAKWGSWRKALIAFVEQVNSDVAATESEQSHNSVTEPTAPVTSNSSPVHVRTISVGLRYDVLRRDHFKCVICGDSPATNHSCRLHVDHINAFSRGGLTTRDNLRTLCSRCNQGKSDKQEIQHAPPEGRGEAPRP